MNSRDDTVDSSGRRAFLTAVAGTAATLAGCGDDTSTEPATSAAEDSASQTSTASLAATETPRPTPSDAVINQLDTARRALTAAFTTLRAPNVYDVENRLYRLDFEALRAFDPDPVLASVNTATSALQSATEELRDGAPEQHTASALLSLSVIARGGAKLHPEIQTTYTGVWDGLVARQRGEHAEALQYMKSVVKTPERWEEPAEELTNGVKSMTATGYPPGVDGFESLRWVKIARLGRKAPLEFQHIGLAQRAFTKAEVSFLDGLFAFDDGEWQTAIRNLEVAEQLYYAAYDNAASIRETDTYGFYRSIVDAHFCRGSKMRRGSRSLLQAAEAYAAGDTEMGKQKEQYGRGEVLEMANHCTDFPTSRR